LLPTRRALLAALLPTATLAASRPVLRIGVLTDLSGARSDSTGLGSVAAARMAALDIGGAGIDRSIEVVSADAGDSPDFAGQILRRWFDAETVEVVADVPDDAVALAVQRICAERGKVALFSAPMTSALTNEACSPTGFAWGMDSYAVAGALAGALAGAGVFLVVTDDRTGRDLQRDLTAALAEIPGTALIGADPASALAAASASGARAVVLCGGGPALARQAASCLAPGQLLAATTLSLADIRDIGLAALQGIVLVQPFYWDTDDRTRAWSQRFAARTGRMPDAPQIGVYGAVRHYLRAVSELGASDGAAVARRMRYTAIEDPFTRGERVRADGRVLRPMLLTRIKSPAESKQPWDYLSILRTIPIEATVRPIAQSLCRLLPGSAG
jgi:branched-chain amino acid transport system substrate-binding protein